MCIGERANLVKELNFQYEHLKIGADMTLCMFLCLETEITSVSKGFYIFML